MNLSIRVETADGQSIIYLEGEVDAFTAPRLQERLTPLVLNAERPKVVVDLAHVTYMDSTGLGIFIGALKAAKKSGCQLLLRNATPRIERLFTITGLHQIIPMVTGKGEEG